MFTELWTLNIPCNMLWLNGEFGERSFLGQIQGPRIIKATDCFSWPAMAAKRDRGKGKEGVWILNFAVPNFRLLIKKCLHPFDVYFTSDLSLCLNMC